MEIFYSNSIMEPLKEIEAKPRKENVWLKFVKEVRTKNPELSYKQVLQVAKESYKPVEKPMKVKKAKSTKSKENDE